MPVVTPQSRVGLGQTRTSASPAANFAIWIRLHAKLVVVVSVLVGIFLLIQSRVPLHTAIQIGADEGFELAKATLCLKGYKLYSDIWCDQPPLHTWLITETSRIQQEEPLTPSLSPSDGERVSEGRVRGYSVLGPRLITVAFAALLLTSVFVMALRLGGLLSATVTTGLLMASPGFLELSSSCMMEIPALAPAVGALCVLLIGRQSKWHSCEIFTGILFGTALGMKLLGLALLPLAALIIWLRCREVGRVTPCALVFGNRANGAHGVTRPTSNTERVSEGRVRGFRKVTQFVFPRGMIQSLLIVGTCTALTFVALDLLIDRGAFLRYFHQSWAAHFGPALSFEYGSPNDHRFPPSLLLKNWDMTIPAALGMVVLLRRIREHPIGILPVAWLALMLTIFATHTPWWSYYYVHIAIPLSWCAAVGFVFVWSALVRKLRETGQARRAVPTQQAGRTVLLRQAGSAVLLALFALCAVSWMGARVYLQIAGIRNSPQTYYSLVLKEIARFKPFTEWIYADNLTYSFHSGIPMPPQLAVVSLKRLWSGEITIAGVGDEVGKFKPGLIALRNDTRELPFQDLLDSEYRLVYHDAENRLYAHRNIANKPDL